MVQAMGGPRHRGCNRRYVARRMSRRYRSDRGRESSEIGDIFRSSWGPRAAPAPSASEAHRAQARSGLDHRDRGEQPPRVILPRRQQHRIRRTVLDDAAVLHDDHLVAQVLHDADVVRDHHQGQAVALRGARRAARGSARAPSHPAPTAARRRPARAAGAPWPARARCAGADRPRTRAGIDPPWMPRARRPRAPRARAPAGRRGCRGPTAARRRCVRRSSAGRARRTGPGRRCPSGGAASAASGRSPPASTGRPSNATVPSVGLSRASSSRTRVDLPEPDSPMMPTASPSATSRSAPSRAVVYRFFSNSVSLGSGYRRVRPRAWISALIPRRPGARGSPSRRAAAPA